MGEAGDVVTYVKHSRRARLEREHSVKRSDSVHFRGSDVHAQRDVIESAGADPADMTLNGVKNWQQPMPGNMTIAIEGNASVRDGALRALPTRLGWTKLGINGSAFGFSSVGAGQTKVQSGSLVGRSPETPYAKWNDRRCCPLSDASGIRA